MHITTRHLNTYSQAVQSFRVNPAYPKLSRIRLAAYKAVQYGIGRSILAMAKCAQRFDWEGYELAKEVHARHLTIARYLAVRAPFDRILSNE